MQNQYYATSAASHPYASSISSSASSSASSIFSVEAQASQASVSSWTGTENEFCPGSGCAAQSSYIQADQIAISTAVPQTITRVNTFPQYQPPALSRNNATKAALPPLRTVDLALPLEQRQNPRRSSTVNVRPPPPLVRQSERKINFVDSLVVSATQMVEVIWPLSVPACPLDERSGRGVLPLRTFIQETLRRSRTSYSTLQVALYYLILIKSHVPAHDFTMEQPEDMHSLRALQCGRRMFLAALILASKYLQDRNFSSRAWSKISGLKVCEINTNEMAFLQAVNWKLHITEPVFERWQQVVLKYTPSQPPASPGGCFVNNWRGVIPSLTPELNSIDMSPPYTSVRLCPPELPAPPRSPLSVSGSQEATPTQLPRFMEPKLDMPPPTPSFSRLLPTPIMTPQSAVSATPAASGMNFGSRRPSMCSAMAQAQSSALARCAMDWNPTFGAAFRRPSTAISSSLSSSPESMISDNSSRSSRSSSISSVSSAGWAPIQANLCRLATCRNARLPYPGQVPRRQESLESIISENVSPEFMNFQMEDDATVPVTPSKASNAVAGSNSRKRGRSSVDMSLQQNVRNMLAEASSPCPTGFMTVLPDRSVAQSFVLEGERKAMQSPKSLVPEWRVPIQKDLGRKRCCASEAAKVMQRAQGPGMWEGIL